MNTPFLGEIRMLAGDRVPMFWALCDGRALSIQQNSALFAAIGTSYGGNGTSTFNLPDLRGRIARHAATLGIVAGEETHTLSGAELPAHTHLVNAVSANGTNKDPLNAAPAATATTAEPIYGLASDAKQLAQMNASLVGSIGGASHNNMMPYIVVNYIIALQGVFPVTNG